MINTLTGLKNLFVTYEQLPEGCFFVFKDCPYEIYYKMVDGYTWIKHGELNLETGTVTKPRLIEVDKKVRDKVVPLSADIKFTVAE